MCAATINLLQIGIKSPRHYGAHLGLLDYWQVAKLAAAQGLHNFFPLKILTSTKKRNILVLSHTILVTFADSHTTLKVRL
jgi:hypothetical protein